MATGTLPEKTQLHVEQFSLVAGLLSYLIPGLGQIVQGRVAKGLLFFVCIYLMFFYGVYLGTGSVTLNGTTYRVSSNVYLPDSAEESGPQQRQWPALIQNLLNRPQFAAQFWVGIASWPAIYQYWKKEDLRQMRGEGADLPQNPSLVQRYLGDFMSEPDPVAINALHNAGDKRLELAWVYTVIAGVLNILVIYDAVAGPAFGRSDHAIIEKKD